MNGCLCWCHLTQIKENKTAIGRGWQKQQWKHEAMNCTCANCDDNYSRSRAVVWESFIIGTILFSLPFPASFVCLWAISLMALCANHHPQLLILFIFILQVVVGILDDCNDFDTVIASQWPPIQTNWGHQKLFLALYVSPWSHNSRSCLCVGRIIKFTRASPSPTIASIPIVADFGQQGQW